MQTVCNKLKFRGDGMKGLICFLLSIALVCCSVPVLGTVDFLYGDVDQNQQINAKDALIILRVSVEKEYLDYSGKRASDVSGDRFINGEFIINAKDALLVLKYAVGKTLRFPVEDLDPQAPAFFTPFEADGVLTPGDQVDFVLDLPPGEDIRILQCNDLQATLLTAGEVCRDQYAAPFGASLEDSIFKYLDEAVAKAKPHLIVLGGDTVEGRFDDNGADWEAIVNHVDSYQIPWALVFGNHERESLAGPVWQTAMLYNSRYCLFASANVTGDSNYTLALRQGGEYKYLLWFLDTNGTNPAWIQNSINQDTICTQSGLQNDQLRWMKNNAAAITHDLGTAIPSLLFMHIPPFMAEEALSNYYPDYFDLPYTLNNGTDFGIATEIPLGSGSDGLKYVTEELNCKGMFFAHQHQVALSIMNKGIRYTWGLKTGINSYHDNNVLGSTLITVDEQTNDFTVKFLYSNK